MTQSHKVNHIPSEEDGHSREFRLRESRTLWESLQSVIIDHNNCRSDNVSVTTILRHQYIKFRKIHSPANQIKKMALIAMVHSSDTLLSLKWDGHPHI